MPKSIDHTSIEWHGAMGRGRTKAITAYVYRVDDFLVPGLDKRSVVAELYIHDKKTTNPNVAYRHEYWTEDGHAFTVSTDSSLRSKKLYYLYKNSYENTKNKENRHGRST